MTTEPDITLVDDEGEEHRFNLFKVIDVDDRQYALLQPEDSNDELVVLRIEGPIDSGTLVTIDDDEWERVSAFLDGKGLLELEEEQE